MENHISLFLSALISLIFGVVASYITSKITSHSEVKKHFLFQKYDKLAVIFDDIAKWINLIRTELPAPPSFFEKKDITNFIKLFFEFDNWIATNFLYISIIDEKLKDYIIIIRDSITGYINEPKNVVDQYNLIIQNNLTQLNKQFVKIGKRIFIGL